MYYDTGLKFGPKHQKLNEIGLNVVGVNPYRGILFQSIVLIYIKVFSHSIVRFFKGK